MGQYYQVVIQDENGFRKVLNRSVDGEYTMAKLMEHSYIGNNFVDTVVSMLHGKRNKVAWVGDYVDSYEHYVWDIPNGLSLDFVMDLGKIAWESADEGVTENMTSLEGKYLVNHTKGVYLDCSKYIEECSFDEGWCIHPLPLLTALGNGFGGGDYHGNCENVGSWVYDLISVEDKAPEGYTLDSSIRFYNDRE